MRTKELPIIKQHYPTERSHCHDERRQSWVRYSSLMKQIRFIAILSDGDLRRALMKEGFSLEHLALEYASKNPKSYTNTELLASEALEIIENGRIQLLPITSDTGSIIGVLHIHDLINAGIKSK